MCKNWLIKLCNKLTYLHFFWDTVWYAMNTELYLTWINHYVILNYSSKSLSNMPIQWHCSILSILIAPWTLSDTSTSKCFTTGSHTLRSLDLHTLRPLRYPTQLLYPLHSLFYRKDYLVLLRSSMMFPQKKSFVIVNHTIQLNTKVTVPLVCELWFLFHQFISLQTDVNPVH